MPKPTILDPQQTAFLQAYTNPESSTYGNAKQSALAVGYSETYADSITVQPKWLSESLGQDKMVQKAEKNLENFLDFETREPVITLVGVLKDKKGNVITKENTSLVKMKADISKFVVSKGSKGKWSEKQVVETTSKNLNVNVDVKQERFEEIIKKAEEEYLKLLDE